MDTTDQKTRLAESKKKLNNRVFLYSGLLLLLIAFVIRWTDMGIPSYYFWILLGIAIALKAVFLLTLFQRRDFKPGLWLYFILAGIVLILVSLLFKHIYPMPLVRFILFGLAVALKVSGLVLMFVQRKG
ncbi:MAG: hypothetical protein LBH58_00750 [Tannerellaceae bacterium]|jgi:hypothetical protein|nr:hypothetical protein [Tannerellaceae bacterium]